MRRILHAVVLAMLVISMSASQAFAGRGDCKGDEQRKRDGSGPNCEFVDEKQVKKKVCSLSCFDFMII